MIISPFYFPFFLLVGQSNYSSHLAILSSVCSLFYLLMLAPIFYFNFYHDVLSFFVLLLLSSVFCAYSRHIIPPLRFDIHSNFLSDFFFFNFLFSLLPCHRFRPRKWLQRAEFKFIFSLLHSFSHFLCRDSHDFISSPSSCFKFRVR